MLNNLGTCCYAHANYSEALSVFHHMHAHNTQQTRPISGFSQNKLFLCQFISLMLKYIVVACNTLIKWQIAVWIVRMCSIIWFQFSHCFHHSPCETTHTHTHNRSGRARETNGSVFPTEMSNSIVAISNVSFISSDILRTISQVWGFGWTNRTTIMKHLSFNTFFREFRRKKLKIDRFSLLGSFSYPL